MRDFRDAFRSLAATPVVTAVAILSLALGIGANTAIFSILDSLSLKTLPVRDPQRLVMVEMGAEGRSSWTNPIWEAIRDRQQPFDRAMAWSATRFNLAQGGQTEMVDGLWASGVTIPEKDDFSSRSVYVNLVSPDWFKTYGTRLLGGRDFTDGDAVSSPPVAIVNEAFTRKFTGGDNPLGRRLRQMGFLGRPAIDRDIVGYVVDAVYRSLREPVPPTMYIPIPQQREPPSSISISVRSAGGSPALLTKSVASALTGVHKDVAITFRQLSEQVNSALLQERIVAMLSGFFGALALLLAGLGLYGVTSYAVSRRRAEIGIRMALGAAPAGVVRMVLRRVALLVGVGVVVGAGLSTWAATFVTTLLYGLPPRDPSTIAIAVLVLALIGAMAGWIPARRASRIDPARVLRDG